MTEYKLSERSMSSQLVNLWHRCFDDYDEAVNYFFNCRYNPENCAVCCVNGKVISAMHTLPVKISYHNKIYNAQYVYAVGTLPEYRGQGYIKKLNEYVDSIALKRGMTFSTLLPASDTLYSYYKKLGYNEYFKIKHVEITPNLICNRNTISYETNTPSFEEMYKMRYHMYHNSCVYMDWNKCDINYAVNLNDIYGGKTIYAKNHGYAICRPIENDTIEITEIVYSNSIHDILSCVNKTFKASKYILRLPEFDNSFGKLGNIKNFGMIKVLSHNIDLTKMSKSSPYIGLTLD